MSLGHEWLHRRRQRIAPSAVNLLPFSMLPQNAVKNLDRLIRLDGDAPCLPLLLRFVFFFCLFFHKGALVREFQIAAISNSGNHVTLSFPSDPSVPSSVSQCVFLPVSVSLVITSTWLFLSVSYDVLWPCSGSRTVTVLSLCHLIDTLFPVTCAHTPPVCARPCIAINQVNNSSPQPYAAAYCRSCAKGCTHSFQNGTSHLIQNISVSGVFFGKNNHKMDKINIKEPFIYKKVWI